MRPTTGRFADQATLTEGFVDVSGRRVYLARAGQGLPLVYLHGVGDLGGGPALTLLADVRDLVQRGYALIGSPDTVRQQFEAYHSEFGFGCFCGVFQFGSLDHEHFLDSLHLFTRKVMPAIRDLGT